MKSEFLNGVRTSAKQWYLPLVLGIVFIIVSILIFLTPVSAYVSLAMLFAFAFLIAGVVEIIHGVSNMNTSDSWGWTLTVGFIDLIIGLLLVENPQVSMNILPYYIGFAMLFRSARAIGWSVELKKYRTPDWGNLLSIAILGAVFAFISLWNPWFAGMTVVFYTGLAFLIVGAFQLYLSSKLRKLNKLTG
jgi:uncharacterized membrane protein HdeD (DUF308 family)